MLLVFTQLMVCESAGLQPGLLAGAECCLLEVHCPLMLVACTLINEGLWSDTPMVAVCFILPSILLCADQACAEHGDTCLTTAEGSSG